MVAGEEDLQGFKYIPSVMEKVPEILRNSRRIDSIGYTLAEFNDFGKSFLEIADYIEKNL